MDVAHEIVVGQIRSLVDRWNLDVQRSLRQVLDYGTILENHVSLTNFEHLGLEERRLCQ
jgi:hypothetical protein